MGKSKEIKDISRIHSRYWLVRTAAGYLQADSERKEGVIREALTLRPSDVQEPAHSAAII